MDTNTLIKTESCPNDNYEPPGVIPYGDSFIAPYSPTPSEYQPSPSPEKPSRLESLPKALNQINPMAQAIDLSITNSEATEAYLTYAPTRHPDRARWQPAYQANLDELGFKLKGERATKMRSNFVSDLKAYVEPANDFKYIRQQDHPQEFRKMVLGFVQAYGKKYWGSLRRGHLLEPAIRRGFLVPRDEKRSDSRLIHVLEQMFDYKARNARGHDSSRSVENQIVPHLNINALSWPANGRAKPDVNKRVSNDHHLHAVSAQDPLSSDDEPLIFGSSFSPFRAEGKSKDRPATQRTHVRKHLRTDDVAPEPRSTRPLNSPKVNRRLEATPVKRRRISKDETKNRIQALIQAKGPSGLQSSQRPARKPAKPQSQQQGNSMVVFHDDPDSAPTTRKEETSTPVTNHPSLPTNVIAGTRLLISASNQPDLAPAIIRMPNCSGIDALLARLGSECDLSPEIIKKISNISATYTWSGEKQRLRKSNKEDFDLFREILETAWEKDATRFADGCKINMLLHVDK